MTAAGLLAMQVCGEYESPLTLGAADWLLSHPPQWKERFCSYGTYYYAQGMYQRGASMRKQPGNWCRKCCCPNRQPMVHGWQKTVRNEITGQSTALRWQCSACQ
ncbi:MAG UNVERIFIED_CONTAM: hypothetical protein LVR18_25255 [Planctomycetaceae bacterium]